MDKAQRRASERGGGVWDKIDLKKNRGSIKYDRWRER